MSRSTLSDKDFDRISYAAGILAATGNRDMADALGELIRRQRAIGVEPTEPVQEVADKLGDPALAAKFADKALAQRAGKVVAGGGRPLYSMLSADTKEQPNVDDRRRANMLPQSFAFRVPHGQLQNVFFARRVPSVGGGGFEVEWLDGETRNYYSAEWVAMQLRLDRWRPTHDPITVGGGS